MIKFTVKVMLAKRGMTQRELSVKSNVRLPMISALCTGSVRHIPVDVLNNVCTALDCQPGDLMEYHAGESVE